MLEQGDGLWVVVADVKDLNIKSRQVISIGLLVELLCLLDFESY